jgi:hypothetical protein
MEATVLFVSPRLRTATSLCPRGMMLRYIYGIPRVPDHTTHKKERDRRKVSKGKHVSLWNHPTTTQVGWCDDASNRSLLIIKLDSYCWSFHAQRRLNETKIFTNARH